MILTTRHTILLCSLLAICLATSGWAAGLRGTFSGDDELIIEERWPGYMETPSGLRYIVEKEGTGDKPLRGMKISVLYTAFLMDGTQFNEALDPEHPFQFKLGGGDVIKGWEEAFSDMRKGEIRILLIPHELGYGLRGNGERIPRRSALVFRVEIIDIEG